MKRAKRTGTPDIPTKVVYRVAAGKALRDKIPREQHGQWKEGKGRTNPINILQQSDAGRMKELVPIRYGRMLQSPLAFYRGAAAVMASDLARTPVTGLKVQACGDCHLMNFGGFATPERKIIFDINDFDETAPAPWEWDVKRLVASIVLAARSIGLGDPKGQDCAVAAARGYREHLRDFSRMDPLRVWYSSIGPDDFIGKLPKTVQKTIRKRIAKAASGSGSELDFPKLAMLDCPADVGAKRSALPAIQGSAGICARTLCRKEPIQPSRPARSDGTASNAAGFRYFLGLGDASKRPAVLRTATTRC